MSQSLSCQAASKRRLECVEALGPEHRLRKGLPANGYYKQTDLRSLAIRSSVQVGVVVLLLGAGIHGGQRPNDGLPDSEIPKLRTLMQLPRFKLHRTRNRITDQDAQTSERDSNRWA